MTLTSYISTCNHIIVSSGLTYLLSTEEWIREDTDVHKAYTAGLIEYASKQLNAQIPEMLKKYSDFKLKDIYYSAHVNLLSKFDKRAKERALTNAIPEFLSHGIVITEVGNAI